jgi:hypothetical protein
MLNIDYLYTARKLAQNEYYQSLYNVSKELGFHIFSNTTQLTRIQVLFLHYISMYASINFDIAVGDIDERVLENDTYVDAYLIYRSQANKNQTKEVAKEKRKYREQSEEESSTTKKSSWLFKR